MMPSIPYRMFQTLRRFGTEERAALAIEAAIMLPLLVMMYVVGYQYFDQYRREAQMMKASNTVADILSRQRGYVTPHDLNGLTDVYETLTFSEDASFMRFTELRRTDDGLDIMFSYATDGQPAMTPAILDGLLSEIPRIDNGRRVTLVEAYTYDQPMFNVGLSDRIIPNVVPIDHRYLGGVAFKIESSIVQDNTSVGVFEDGCNSDPVEVNGFLLVDSGDCDD
ncbi:hypothetical protein JDO7802_02014 [Jannaschia donghaensis]|uniref:Flp pilus assembly protein TadG n=2 Tax=Jannaschia donghaensis TaxID=420998 RepID=A0A0M6YL40_9RHOB|nr:hypothetical protein JDO7802_02014 [Jannaschia donghaensis]